MPGQKLIILQCKCKAEVDCWTGSYFADSETFDAFPVFFAATLKKILAATTESNFFQCTDVDLLLAQMWVANQFFYLRN
jgi:hypothetical protein